MSAQRGVLGVMDAVARWADGYSNSQPLRADDVVEARAAVAGSIAALQDACGYVGQRTDGDLLTLTERAQLWMRESQVLLAMRQELIDGLKSDLAAARMDPHDEQ